MTPNKIRGTKAITKLKKLPEIPPTVINGEKTKLVIPGVIVAPMTEVQPNTNPKKAPAAGPIVLAKIITGTCINVTLNALIRKYPIGVKYMMISMAKNKAKTHIWRTDSFDLFIFPPTFVSFTEYDVTNQIDVFIHRLWSCDPYPQKNILNSLL